MPEAILSNNMPRPPPQTELTLQKRVSCNELVFCRAFKFQNSFKSLPPFTNFALRRVDIKEAPSFELFLSRVYFVSSHRDLIQANASEVVRNSIYPALKKLDDFVEDV